MAIRFAVYTAILYAGLVHNVFCAQDDILTCNGEFRRGHLTGDCCLVLNRMRQSDATPWESMTTWNREAGFGPYRSQLGLQAIVLSAIGHTMNATPEQIAAVASPVFGFMTAALVAAFFASVARRITPMAGDVGVLLTACSPPMLAFSPAIYWSLPATLAPFVFAWLAYPWASRSWRRFATFLVGMLLLVCVKGLCGYEYITTVIVSPVAALVYHRAVAGDSLRRWVLPAVAVGVAGLAGFAGALGLHATQLAALTGGNGFDAIRERAVVRTAVPTDGEVETVRYPVFAPELAFLPERVRLPVQCFVNYFHQPAVTSPQTWGHARFAVPLIGVLAVAGLVLMGIRRRFPEAAALAPAVGVGLLGAISWQALAVNHMVYHGHLNLIVFCVPCLLLAFAAIGAGLGIVFGNHSRLAVCVVVLLIGVNMAVLANRASERTAIDAVATERVRAVLRGEEKSQRFPERITDPLFAALPTNPASLPDWAVFAASYAPATPDAPLGAQGWVLVPREPTGRFPLSVVAVRGSQVVPIRVGYFRLTAVEQLHGQQAACVAYQAVIPPGERPRLFAVPSGPGLPVVELTGK